VLGPSGAEVAGYAGGVSRIDPETRAASAARPTAGRIAREAAFLMASAFVLALVLKTFFVQAFWIPSPSMTPTLRPGDRILVIKVPYWFGEPHRGDIVVFERTDRSIPSPDRGLVGEAVHWLGEGLGFQPPDHPDYVKRVIGEPGDVVWAKRGRVYVNGLAILEAYLTQPTATFPKTQVPDGKLFVMGDNRAHSLDSRSSLGFVPIDHVVGKAFLTIWPLDRFDVP
jgi:signal peptidase I